MCMLPLGCVRLFRYRMSGRPRDVITLESIIYTDNRLKKINQRTCAV